MIITCKVVHSCKIEMLCYSMASLNQSGRFCDVRLQAWFCTFYLAPLSRCSGPSLSDQGGPRVAPVRFPERSGHASPCSGYAPGGSGNQKRREVGPKTERAGLEISTFTLVVKQACLLQQCRFSNATWIQRGPLYGYG